MKQVVILVLIHTMLTALIIYCSFVNLSADISLSQAYTLINNEIPMIQNTAVLSFSLLLYFFIAVATSKKNYNKYKNELIGFNIGVPIIIILIIFPNADSLSHNVDQRYNLLLFGNLVLHTLITKFLAPKIWLLSGRTVEK